MSQRDPMQLKIPIKTLFLLTFIFFAFTATATNYYLSTSGNDANSGTAPSSPWQTLNKLNSFKNLKPGDNVLFKRGDTFYGSITVSNSGAVGNPITYGAYGTGENPILSGFSTLTGWTNQGGGIWTITDNSLPTMVNLLTIDDAIQPLGRWPKDFNNTYKTSSGNSSITDNELTGTPNWTGGELVMRKYAWILDRNVIKAQNAGTISYSASTSNPPINGSEYFIQNNINTLTTFGDWCYDAANHKISMYFGAAIPSDYVIKVSKISRLVSIDNGYSYNTFENIDFEGANDDAVFLNVADNSKVITCTFRKLGKNAVRMVWSKNVTISGNTFTDVLNNAITTDVISTNAIVTGNTLTRIAVIAGAGQSGDNSYQAITVYGDSSVVEDNSIDSTGYNPIAFYGNGTVISKNFINHFNIVKQDGGGIYTWNANYPIVPFKGQKITNNIILNGHFDASNAGRNFGRYIHGIYLDVGSKNIEISGNTIANNDYSGIFVHDDSSIYIHDNTLYNNLMPLRILSDNEMYQNTSQIVGQKNINIKNNVIAAKNVDQYIFHFKSITDDLDSFGALDSNYYLTENGKYNFYSERVVSGKRMWDAVNYEIFKTSTPYDANSTETLLPFPQYYVNSLIGSNKFSNSNFSSDISNVLWTYNCIKSWDNTGQLDAGSLKITQSSPLSTSWNAGFVKLSAGAVSNTKNYIVKWSMKGSSNGVVGILLNENGDTNDPLTQYQYVNLSTSRTENEILFSFPTSSDNASLEFMFRDQDSTVWIDNVEMYETNVTINNTNTNLEYNASSSNITIPLDANYMDVKGTNYKGTIILAPFSSAVLIRNGPITNQPPIANAGPDQTILLPISLDTLKGSGKDSDGSTSSYNWTKVSGPSGGSITNANSATTTVTGLVQGIYEFELKVTDNNGATGKDTMQLTVNTAVNHSPTANAGVDLKITLPTNTVTLNGSGKDTDGTVAIFFWTKISGPSSFNITNTASPITDVSGLLQGVYEFELQVTDNNGAVGRDTVRVTVNAAANMLPVANAGTNKTITLPVNTLSLAGSGTDVDGTITNYLWTKISGPSRGTINNANSDSATINNLSQGVYEFELTVTDDKGATGKDTVQVNVNAAPNKPPTVNAGANQSITLPTNTVTLSGNGTDADGMISSYLWTKISGPSGGTINNANSASATVTGLGQGLYQFELKVTDNNGATGKDTMQLTVNAAPNKSPTVYAGANQSIILPTNTVTLSGSGNDSDGTITSFQWTKISGPSSYNFTNSSSAATTVSGLIQGVYQFELKATDNKGAVGKDTVQITVNAAPNIPPTADAGSNQSITIPTNTITLNGSGTDTDGTISSYSWTKISGPSGGEINNPNSASSVVNSLSEGVYQFELTVTDDRGSIGKDTVQITTVNAAPNMPPTANAGKNQTIRLPTNSILLNGSGTDPDGTISSYSWTKISGPSSGTINNANSDSTTINNLSQGVYEFELTVTDDKGDIGKDTVQVTVNSAANISPTANASGDQTITLPTYTITLNGSGTDPDGTISSYSWRKISGPSGGTINNLNSASTIVNNLSKGVYKFELTVTDDKGAVGKDTVQVTVNAAANMPPTANASGDKTITLPTDSVSLSGNGTDPDGRISSYSWSKISGPSAFSIKNFSSANSEVSGLVEGVYLFELKVTDNNGATGKDTVKVTVNPATNIPPVAQAGSDQTITLPTNTISLNGKGTDSDGTISTYLWTKIAGPAAGTITDASSASTTVKGLIAGNYIFQLTVTDNKGAKATDSIYVTVNAPKNMAPIANAGGDLTIVLPLNTIYLNGNGKDTDGTITAYQWKQIAGPDSASISNENSASTVVKNLVGGTYEFELTVTDNNEAKDRDTVSVVVALGRISAQQNSINIYPNPVKDIATVEINTAEPTSNLSILISDFAGRIVYKKMINSINYQAVERINMSNFSKGSYTITVFFNSMDKQVFPILKL